MIEKVKDAFAEHGVIPSLGLVWLLPIWLGLLVIFFIKKPFSYVGISWQSQNHELIFFLLTISFFCLLLAAYLVSILLRVTLKAGADANFSFNGFQSAVMLVIGTISMVGIYKSFGGTIFSKSYDASRSIWLGYGAWGATLDISVCYMLSIMFARRIDSALVFIAILGLYLPLLLLGTRIDLVSVMLAFFYCYTFIYEKESKFKWVRLVIYIIFLFSILKTVGLYRYLVAPNDVNLAASVTLKSPEMFYLSTIGDIGVSFFQVVGLLENFDIGYVGVNEALDRYVTRLLPGSFFPNRPGDLAALVPPPALGGGALHAFGEGYLIAGLPGLIAVSV